MGQDRHYAVPPFQPPTLLNLNAINLGVPNGSYPTIYPLARLMSIQKNDS